MVKYNDIEIKVYRMQVTLAPTRDINLRDELFENDLGIVSLHPTNRTHSVAYKNQKYFDCFACLPPVELSEFIIKHSQRSYYEEKIQKCQKVSYCAANCSH